MNKKIYISGKMSGLTKKDYLANFRKAESYLKEQGYDVVNPSKICCGTDISYGELLWIDLKTLMNCDAIYMLNNWDDSKGATAEYYFAKAIDLEIMFEKEKD